MINNKSIVLSVICVCMGTSAVFSAVVVDRLPEGVYVGPIFQPDTIGIDLTKTLDKLTCLAPTGQRPFYEIAIPLGDWDGGSEANIESVTINGFKCTRSTFYLYCDGMAHRQSVYEKPWITRKGQKAKNVILVAKALWRNNETIEAKVQIKQHEKSKRPEQPERTETLTVVGVAPPTGGMPAGTVDYESFALIEQAGFDRKNEPVEVSVSTYLDEVATPDNEGGLASELRLYRISESGQPEPVPIQLFDVGGSTSVLHENKHGRPWSKTARIFFFADVGAKQSVPYIITYGSSSLPASPAPASTLDIKGESPGYIVSNRFYTCTLDPKSGQIKSIKLKSEAGKEVPIFTNSLTHAMHWNPDAYGATGGWGHTFAWDPPDHTDIATKGPMLFRVTNSGRMPPRTQQVYTSVSYSFYAETPYIGVTTMMDVRDDFSGYAIRNGEIVVDSQLVTHFVWKDKAGQINRLPALVKTAVLDDRVVITEPDIPWVAMVNEYDGYGIAAVWSKVDAFHCENGTLPVHRPAYFFINHSFWEIPITYFTRCWVWPFGHKGRRSNVMVEPGAVYYERGAFYAFKFAPGSDYEQVERVDAAISQPLIIKTGH